VRKLSPAKAVKRVADITVKVFRKALLLPLFAAGLLTAASTFIAAHENHDAGAPQSIETPSAQRISAQSKTFELIAKPKVQGLVVYLDAADDNQPIENASIEIESNGKTIAAKETAAGTYAASAEWLGVPGSDVTITVKLGEDQSSTTFAQPIGSTAPHLGYDRWIQGAVFAGLGFGIALVAFRSGRERWGGAGLAVLMLLLLVVTGATSREQTPAAPTLIADTVPHRHADGSVFLPKQAQHLLQIRTSRAVAGEDTMSFEIAGRVIVDPNYSARVHATRDGRIEAGPKGFPRVGQLVARGDVLAYLVPTLSAFEEASLRQTLAQIEREMALLVPRADAIGAINPNIPMGEATASVLQELQIQSQSLTRQKEIVLAALDQKIEIKAAVTGVVAAAQVWIGQTVAARDPLFDIVDRHTALVEGWEFGPVSEDAFSAALAVTEHGHTLPLEFLGRGPVLHQQAVPYLFRISANAESVDIGTPVRILLRGKEKTKGVPLPAAAVERGPGNLPVVWEHTTPEMFVPHVVTVARLDATHVIANGAIKPGMRLVVSGAGMLSQVR